jgi:hypothetical protein
MDNTVGNSSFRILLRHGIPFSLAGINRYLHFRELAIKAQNRAKIFTTQGSYPWHIYCENRIKNLDTN